MMCHACAHWGGATATWWACPVGGVDTRWDADRPCWRAELPKADDAIVAKRVNNILICGACNSAFLNTKACGSCGKKWRMP